MFAYIIYIYLWKLCAAVKLLIVHRPIARLRIRCVQIYAYFLLFLMLVWIVEHVARGIKIVDAH